MRLPERPRFSVASIRWVRWWERGLLIGRPMRVGAQDGYVIWYKVIPAGEGLRVYHATASPAGVRVGGRSG